MDHASYTAFRAMGHHPVLHYTWVYDRPVDVAALQRLSERLHRGRLARLVQPSPTWGGRHRWVRPDEHARIEVERSTRPRSQIQQWSLEVSRRPIDPEVGPPWRFGVLSLDCGGSAVALVVSHTVTDNGAMMAALAEALGERDPGVYPRRGAVRRSRWGELLEVITSVPEKVRAVVLTLRRVRSGRRLSTVAPRPPAPQGRLYTPPQRPPTASPCLDGAARAVTFVPETAWAACAERLGGTPNVLATAVAARLGQRLGRTQQDASVNVTVPVSIRKGDDDLRGNALSYVVVNLDPDVGPVDLRPARAALKAVLTAQVDSPLPLLAALPLVPLVPVWLLRRLEKFALGADVQTVGCSNLGRVSDRVMQIDGAPCQYAYCQFNEPGRPTAELARMGGQGFLGVTTSGGRVTVNSVAFRPGADNSDAALLDLVHAVLDDFGLHERLTW